MEKFTKKYSIGLDIGVSSVGYAVVTEDHKVPTFKFKVLGNTEKRAIKKNLIGSVTFDSAKTAGDTRSFRANSRRIERRNNRIKYLREIFQSEIEKVDKNFYRRLDETFRKFNDKSDDIKIKHPFFGKKKLEKEFHRKYPTIYHLRKYLADTDSKEAPDIREVYLALSHIMKYRGNFLTAGKINPNNIDIREKWIDFLRACNLELGLNLPDNYEELDSIFKENIARKDKVDKILKFFPEENKKKDRSIFKQLLQLLFGLKTKFQRCFDLEEEIELSFTEEKYDENLEKLLDIIGDNYADLFETLKTFRDSILLSSMLTHKGSTHARFSATMIDRYEEHRKDLQRLKTFVRLNLSEKDYEEIFNDESAKGYAGYISNHMKLSPNEEKSKSKLEYFYSNLTKKINKIEGSQYFLDKIEQGTLLRKLRTTDNGSIPNQIHRYEMENIIENQAKHFPFLEENRDKLISILTFKIPYYVGPLAKPNKSRFSWLVRNDNLIIESNDDEETQVGKIRPWNFDKLVDLDATRRSFIDHLIGKDVILLNEKVLPKRSLIYEEFMLQNELTRVKYKDKYGKTHKFTSDMRSQIISDLFKEESGRIKEQDLLKYLNLNHDELKAVEIVSGIKNSFNSILKTYHDFVDNGIFSRQFLDSEEYQDDLEEIIKIVTVFDDKKSIKDYLDRFYSDFLDEKQIVSLSKLRYTGWGKYSKKLLVGIRDDDTGFNILQFIRNDDQNRNLNQVIEEEPFRSKIMKLQSQHPQEEDVFEQIKELAGSSALKRGILNSIKVVDELVEIIGYPPENIVIEMARENMTTAEGSKKSQTRKVKLEATLKKIENDILTKDGKLPFSNEELQSEKLYLYCLQKGKDMYSLDSMGNPEPLYIDQLDQYEVDHIIPYSVLPVDSVDNKVLTHRKNNQNKRDSIPDKKTVHEMKAFWNQLLDAKLINQTKFQRLTMSERTPDGVLTDDIKAGFIERQLVETRQIIKHVARILDDRFDTSKIITLKSQLVSNFRNTFHIMKLRDLNDYHHAHDAYLNVVVAQTLLKAYPKLAPELTYGQFKNFNKHLENRATVRKQIYSNVMKFFNSKNSKISKDIWDCSRDLPIIKNVIYNSQINFVKRTVVKKGAFFNENPISEHSKISIDKRFPIKQGLDPESYGGYTPLNSALTVFVVAEKFDEKKKKCVLVKDFFDIYIINYKKFNENPMEYLNDSSSNGFLAKHSLNKVIYYKKIAKYSLIQLSDNKRFLLESSSNLQKTTQFRLTDVQSELFFHMKRFITRSNLMDLKSTEAVKESSLFIDNHKNEFDEIANNLFEFARQQLGETTGLKTLISGYANRQFKNIVVTDEVVRYYYDNFIKMFSFVKSGVSQDISNYFAEKATVKRPRYRPNKKYLSATLIHQSVTGLYETRIDLSKLGEE